MVNISRLFNLVFFLMLLICSSFWAHEESFSTASSPHFSYIYSSRDFLPFESSGISRNYERNKGDSWNLFSFAFTSPNARRSALLNRMLFMLI